MMRMIRQIPTVSLVLAALLAGGCANYRWTSTVPAGLRTVSVPTMRNESNVTEIGNVMTRQVLREFQREGTFKIGSTDDAALEVQGVVKSVEGVAVGRNRRAPRVTGFDSTARVEISVVDKRSHKVLIDNRVYTAHATFMASDDYLTAQRDASGRLAEDLARQVVDDVLNLNW